MGEADYHVPVLPSEVLAALDPQPGGKFFDGTVGGGGHSALILSAVGSTGFLYGCDQDPEAIAEATAKLQRLGSNFELQLGNFADVLASWPPEPLDGLLLDLGVSSHQLDTAERGFSFMREGPLDMRMSPQGPTTAADLVNGMDERTLANLIFDLGEERRSRAIARAVAERREVRPFTTTTDLAECVARVVPRSADGLHPATRTFQALRLAVNDELGVLERVLPHAIARLKPGGRLVVISFHSLEDRMVKHALREAARGCVCPPRAPACVCGRTPTLEIVTSRPLTAGPEELARNVRARSAKLRVARRIA